MQPQALYSMVRQRLLARLQEEEEDLVPLVAQLSTRWACYLQAALTRVQFGLRGHPMGSDKQDYGLFYDAELGAARAIPRIAAGRTIEGHHKTSRELTVEEHVELHQALALAELQERQGFAVDVEQAVWAALPGDIQTWAEEVLMAAQPMHTAQELGMEPTDALVAAITQSVRAERNRWRELTRHGVR